MKPEKKGIRPEKLAEATELDERVAGALYMIIADYTGMDMPTTTALKDTLRESGASFNVVKKTMLNRALSVGAKDLMTGQTAMIYGDGDVAEVAKIIKKFTAANETPVVTGGFVEGKAVSASDFVELAKLPSKDVMRAMLLGTLQAPCTQLVGVLDQKVSSLVYVLSAVKDKKEQEA
jgi:large subunit ribosomal protein L10